MPDAPTLATGSQAPLEEMPLVNTREPNGRGEYSWAVIEALDAESAGIDVLQHM